jgi:hypothetical protein
VSGTGDDGAACSRTAPCKTFVAAIAVTETNGEINCLDPGGYGSLTITKSITIDCTGTLGSILSSGTNGITINLSTTPDPLKSVVLRGLSINGAGGGGQAAALQRGGAVQLFQIATRLWLRARSGLSALPQTV